MIGQVFRSFLNEEHRDLELTPNSSKQIEAVLQRLDGEEFPADIWIGPMHSDDANSSYIAVVRDISKRIQAQRELETTRQKFFHQEKMAAIGHLAAGILHEVGNPIAAIAGAASDLKGLAVQSKQGSTECEIKDDVNENIDLINEQAIRLSRITREIADFASPKQRERELLDLNGLINSTARLLSYDRRFRTIKMDLQLDRELPAISGVADQLTQVFMNLLLNAMDASMAIPKDKRQIQVTSNLTRDQVSVSVRDFGSGMSPETRDRALEPFYTTKPVGQGSGLGLSLCDSIIHAHGGSIELHSEPNMGTRIQVNLPVEA